MLPQAARTCLSGVFVALLLLCRAPAPAGQHPASTPALTDADIEHFLRTARIVRTHAISEGVTGSVRATLSDGTLTHDAQIQTVDQTLREFRSSKGVEFDFKDDWRYNIAAYRIDRLLDLQLVPVSVERAWRQRDGAFTWWIDDIIMSERDRYLKKLPAPDVNCWNEQIRLLRVLDQLIANTDRNLGNVLISRTWRLWAIDHTRAFRKSRKPRSLLGLVWIDRGVLERLAALDFRTLHEAVGEYVGDFELKALLARRDAIVTHFRAAGKGAVSDRECAAGR